ncbi:MAG: ABC transporter permease [Candidatus Omnitrophica bacterium]|nr:ABC transporter permease [Candidatus Omnitrophota bacterium]
MLALRDIKLRYKQTLVGVGWAVLQPVTGTLLFSLIFGHWAKMPSDGTPYPVFVYAGIVLWMFFSGSYSSASQSLVSSAPLVVRTSFPRIIIPLATLGAHLVDFCVSFVVMAILAYFYGVRFSAGLFLVPVILFFTTLAALGVGVFLSALMVAYRDVRHVIPFMTQVWMYASPVVYSSRMIPEPFHGLFFLNPMTGFIHAFRSALFSKPFHWDEILISVVVTLAMFILGVLYFERSERRFAEII